VTRSSVCGDVEKPIRRTAAFADPSGTVWEVAQDIPTKTWPATTQDRDAGHAEL
jgi:hypothetical protein